MLWLLLGVPLSTIQAVQTYDRAAIERARKQGLPARIAAVVRDADQPLPARLHAARALSRLGGSDAVAALAPLAAADESPEDRVLARESAKALKQLRATDQLGAAVASRDPEVRALAASAGAAPKKLCVLLKDDPWPMVRVAAAQGLAKAPAHGNCLATGLKDTDTKVRTASARSAAKVRQPALRTPLRRLAGDAGAPVDARVEAVVALGALGDLEPANAVLRTHLKDGAIEPLALAAVRAFAQAEDWASVRKALDSAAHAVVVSAARRLLNEGSAANRAAVQSRIDGADGRLKAGLLRLQRDLAPASPPDPDPPGMNWD